jgi:hypothetical protein
MSAALSNERAQSAPDVDHLRWAIDRRAEIQHTLLALYDYGNRKALDNDILRNYIFDHLIAAAFSLWRAVFLSETDREMAEIYKSQKAFLATVVSTNAITFQDDYKNRAWTVGYYLEAAQYRLDTAAAQLDNNDNKLHEKIMPLIRLRGTEDKAISRYEYECVHCALRMIFKELYPDLPLPMLKAAFRSFDNE